MRNRILLAFLFAGILCLCMALAGCSSGRTLPEGGFDYRVQSSGVLLGYPIPRLGENSYLLTAEDDPSAFLYDARNDTYRALSVRTETVLCADGAGLSVRYAEHDGGKTYFSQSERVGGAVCTVFEGDYRGQAVAAYASKLLLCSETGYETVSGGFLSLCDIYQDRLLFLVHTGGQILLYSYEDDVCDLIFEAGDITDAWYAQSEDTVSIVFRADELWYIKEGKNEPYPAVIAFPPQAVPDVFDPLSSGIPEGCFYYPLRGSLYGMAGDNDSMWFVSLLTGVPIDVDMGGIFRFDRMSCSARSAVLPLSPDRQYVFLTDFDCLYRLCLYDGTLSIILNEAPTYENTCPISSCAAADGSHLLLSQASAEYTEFVAVITEGVFSEELPEERHEHEKIDLDFADTEEDE